jgi:polar amino acid transport system substrate-binding protein
MDISHRYPVLRRTLRTGLSVLACALTLQGCGLVIDAVQFVHPIAANQLDSLCARGKLQVGIAVEPLQPFVFPAIFTDEGLRVTGLDVELIRDIAAALSTRCGSLAITPILHLVRFRDLFVELNEGKLDLFVSAVGANIAFPTRAGLAYSTPYFDNGGVAGITRRQEVSEAVRAALRGQEDKPDTLAAAAAALAGLTVGVQEGTSAHLFAESHLTRSSLVLCDSLPAAFESLEPAIDVILGKQPVLQFIATRVRKDWKQLTGETGKPVVLTREHYVVVTAEESYGLRSLVNDLLFRLEESGRLAEMRRRWLEEIYAYPRRAAAEGLPFSAEDMPRHYDQGQCRTASKP